MANKGQTKSHKKTTVKKQSSKENVVCAKMGESDLRLILDLMLDSDLSPSQLASIINKFDELKPNEKKTLIKYSKAVSNLHSEQLPLKKPPRKEHMHILKICAQQ
jgi:hypothetical protein